MLNAAENAGHENDCVAHSKEKIAAASRKPKNRFGSDADSALLPRLISLGFEQNTWIFLLVHPILHQTEWRV